MLTDPDPSALTWTAILRDGSTFPESDGGGFRPVVAAAADGTLDSVLVHGRDGTPLAQVVIRDGMRPIFGRLWINSLNPNTGEESRGLRAVVYGWQRTVNGTNVKTLIWVLADGQVYVADRDLDEIETT